MHLGADGGLRIALREEVVIVGHAPVGQRHAGCIMSEHRAHNTCMGKCSTLSAKIMQKHW